MNNNQIDFFLVPGMSTLITVMILRIPDLELIHIADILDWIFLIFPPYAMASAIGDLYSNVRFTNICSRDVLELLCGLGTFKNPCCVGKELSLLGSLCPSSLGYRRIVCSLLW